MNRNRIFALVGALLLLVAAVVYAATDIDLDANDATDCKEAQFILSSIAIINCSQYFRLFVKSN